MKKDKSKQLQKAEKKETSIVRSSAAEYLAFVAATGKGGIEAVYADKRAHIINSVQTVLRVINWLTGATLVSY